MIGGGLILLIVNDSSGSTLGLPNDSFANLVYLGGAGAAVLAAGIVASGRRLGDTARSLAAWMLIILVFVAGYQYRYELQDFANRITAGLVPGSPLTVNDGGNTVMLEKLANGHFGARGVGQRRERRFHRRHRRLGHRADRGRRGRGGLRSGGAQLQRADLDGQRHGEGGARRLPTRSASAPSRAGACRCSSPTRGTLDQSLLGMNFIGSLSGFDVRGDRMILRD